MTAVLIILAAVLVLVMAMSFVRRPVRARRRVIVERPVRRGEAPVMRERVVEKRVVEERVVEE